MPGNFLKILSEAESAVIAQKIKGNDNGASKPACMIAKKKTTEELSSTWNVAILFDFLCLTLALAPHNRHDELLKALDDQGHPSLDLVESGKESSLPKVRR